MPKFTQDNKLEYEVTQNSGQAITIRLTHPGERTITTRFEYENELGEKKQVEIPVNKWS